MCERDREEVRVFVCICVRERESADVHGERKSAFAQSNRLLDSFPRSSLAKNFPQNRTPLQTRSIFKSHNHELGYEALDQQLNRQTSSNYEEEREGESLRYLRPLPQVRGGRGLRNMRPPHGRRSR